MKDNEGIDTYNKILWFFYLNKDIIYGTRDICFCNLKFSCREGKAYDVSVYDTGR